MTTKPNSRLRILTHVCAVAMLGLAGVANAQFLQNGDFESVTGNPEPGQTFTSWTESANAATNAAVAIGGTFSAELRRATAGRMYQAVNDPGLLLNTFVFDVDFATSNPGGSLNRSFHVILQSDPSFTTFRNIGLRVVDTTGNGLGDVQLFNGASWVTTLADAVIFSESDTTISLNHLQIVGDYSGATPHYDLFVNSSSAMDLTLFQGTPPATGDTLRQISFETGNSVAGSFSIVDNVSLTVVPEPATWSLLGLGLAAMVVRCRRKSL